MEKDILLPNDSLHQDIPTLQAKTGDFCLDRSARGGAELFQNILDSLVCLPWAEQITHSFKTGAWTITLHGAEDRTPRIYKTERILSLPNDHMAVPAILRSPYFRNRLILSFLQGLRRIERLENASWSRLLSPAADLLAARIEAADTAAIMMNLAYLLAGDYPDLWHHAQVMDDADMIMFKAINSDETETKPSFDLSGAFHAWFGHRGRVAMSDHPALRMIDKKMKDADDPTLYRRGLTLAAIRSYCAIDGRQSYLDDQTGMITLDGLDAIDAAYLAQIEREQHVVTYGSVGMRDRTLADRLFGAVT